MRRIREVLRLKHELKLKHRAISASVGISKGSVSDYLKRAKEAGLSWEAARQLDDAQVEQLLFKLPGRNEPRCAHRSTSTGCIGNCAGPV